MKALSIFILFFLSQSLLSLRAQYSHDAHSYYSSDEKYSYQAVTGDPTGARVYTLDNGFQLWFLPDPFIPVAEGRLVVRAGSVQDPDHAKGTAFLTAQLLKYGTDRLGTTNYAQEKPILDSLNQLLEAYRTTGENIDYNLAKCLCLAANEVACYTSDPLDNEVVGPQIAISPDYTSFSFVADLPKINKGLVYMAELVRNPVFRGMDRVLQVGNANNPIAKEFDPSVLSGLFPNHPYGSHPVAGTAEGFNRPSVVEIRNFFQKWYGPNNMALFVRGNLNGDELIRLVDSTFGKLGRRDVQFTRFAKWNAPMPPSLETLQLREGTLIFRGKGIETKDPAAMELIQHLFEVLVEEESDNGHVMWNSLASPLFTIRYLRDGTLQSITPIDYAPEFTLTELKLAIIEILDRLKTGDFEAWQIQEAADRAEKFRSEKVSMMDRVVNAYGIGWDWTDFQNRFDWMRSLSKQEVQQIAGSIYANYALAAVPQKLDQQKLRSPLPEIDYLDGECFPRNEWERALANIPPRPNAVAKKKTKEFVRELRDSSGNQLVWIEQHDSALFSLDIYLNRISYPWLDWTGECTYLNLLGQSKALPDSVSRYFHWGKGIRIGQEAQYVKITLNGLNREFEKMLAALKSLLELEPNNSTAQLAADTLNGFPPNHYPYLGTGEFYLMEDKNHCPTPSQTTAQTILDSLPATLDHWRHLPQRAYLCGNLGQRNKVLQWLADFRRSPQILPPNRPIVYLCNAGKDSSLSFSWVVPLEVDMRNASHRERIAMREFSLAWENSMPSIPDPLPPYVLSGSTRSWWYGVGPGEAQTLRWDGTLSSLTPVSDLKSLATNALKNPAEADRILPKIEEMRVSEEADDVILQRYGLNYINGWEWPEFVTSHVAWGYFCGPGDYLVEQRYQQDPELTVADFQDLWQKYLRPNQAVWYIRAPKHLLNPDLFKDLGQVILVK